MTNHDYSFSVGIPLVLPEGTLNKEQMAELIEEVRREALAVAKEYIDNLENQKNAIVGDGWILFPDHRLFCSHEHEEDRVVRSIASWSGKPTKEEIAMEVEAHYSRMHRK
jgi:hypothetical protein